MNLLITGGSGFIGTNAMEWALNQSYNVLNFDIQQPKNADHLSFWKNVDIRDKISFGDALEKFKPSYILHLASMTGMDIQDISFLDANTVGIENLINICRNVESVKRIVFTSSLLVCENGYIPKSDTDYCPPNLYGESKMSGEKLVRSANLHCEWAIVRPTSIWGPWFDYSYKAFFKTIDRNKYMHIGKEEFQKPASFVGNTTYMLMKILLNDDPEISEKTFYLADYPWYSTKEWANTIQRTLNSKSINTAPLWILRFVAVIGSGIKKLFNYDPPLTSFRLNNMLTGGVYPVENTMRVVGKLPFNLEEAVFITAQWMFENNLIKHKPSKI